MMANVSARYQGRDVSKPPHPFNLQFTPSFSPSAFLVTQTSFGTQMAAPLLASFIAFRSSSRDASGVLSLFSANSFQVLT